MNYVPYYCPDEFICLHLQEDSCQSVNISSVFLFLFTVNGIILYNLIKYDCNLHIRIN